jgi:hypothetical protein
MTGLQNEGFQMLIYQPFARPANQDKKHFELGASTAKPAAGYFADVLGLSSEQPIKDAVAGLSSAKEIEDVLFNLFQDRWQARDYMKWRMGITQYAPRTKRRATPW